MPIKVHGDRITFSGNVQSRPEKDYDEAERELHVLLADSNVSSKNRKKALKKYEDLKKSAGRAKAIKETTAWIFGIGGAGVGFIHTFHKDTAAGVGMLLAACGIPVGTFLASVCIKDKNGERLIGRALGRLDKLLTTEGESWLMGYEPGSVNHDLLMGRD